MRTVSFVLLTPTTAQVEACFATEGLELLTEYAGRWNYPSGTSAVLYVTCSEYKWHEFPEEHADILRCTGGRIPSVEVHADVSGRVPGDAEVRFLAELLLSRFDGFAFDDFLSLAHAWTLDEIRENAVVDGLHFFDSIGAYKRALEGAG